MILQDVKADFAAEFSHLGLRRVLLEWSKGHGHSEVIHFWLRFNLSNVFNFPCHFIEVFTGDVAMGSLTAFENHTDENFVVFLKALARFFELGIEIVFADFWAHADFFGLNLDLFFAVFFVFTVFVVFITSVVHDATDGGTGVRGDFNEIKALFFSSLNGRLNRKDAELAAIGVDHAHFCDANGVVDSGASITTVLISIPRISSANRSCSRSSRV